MKYSLILSHLYEGDRHSFVDDLLAVYKKKGFAVVNFLYFANAMHYRLLEKPATKRHLEYRQALLAGDFLLTDGIALQTYQRCSNGKRHKNLNGTDLMPHILKSLLDYYSVSLYVYGVYDPKINKDASRMGKGLDNLLRDYPNVLIVSSHQSNYADRGEDFPFDQFARTAEKDGADIKIFLNCTGTSFQEVRVDQHIDRFSQNNMIVCNLGGFLDFVSGFEKRAPHRAIKARVFETPYRLLSHPSKNLKKVWRMFGIVRIWKNKFFYILRGLHKKK